MRIKGMKVHEMKEKSGLNYAVGFSDDIDHELQHGGAREFCDEYYSLVDGEGLSDDSVWFTEGHRVGIARLVPSRIVGWMHQLLLPKKLKLPDVHFLFHIGASAASTSLFPKEVAAVLDLLWHEFAQTKYNTLMDEDEASKVWGYQGDHIYSSMCRTSNGLLFYNKLDSVCRDKYATWVADITEMPAEVAREIMDAAADFQNGLSWDVMKRTVEARLYASMLFSNFVEGGHSLLSIWPGDSSKSEVLHLQEVRWLLSNAICLHAEAMGNEFHGYDLLDEVDVWEVE